MSKPQAKRNKPEPCEVCQPRRRSKCPHCGMRVVVHFAPWWAQRSSMSARQAERMGYAHAEHVERCSDRHHLVSITEACGSALGMSANQTHECASAPEFEIAEFLIGTGSERHDWFTSTIRTADEFRRTFR